MANTFKSGSNPSGITNSLFKNNFTIGLDISGPTVENTGYYNGITPPSGGYTIYQLKSVKGPSIRVAPDDSELITIAKQYGASNAITTKAQALSYFNSQNDIAVTNFDYPNIVTSGLQVNIDAGFVSSYPTTASTWYDISGNANNETLQNNPTFTSANSGSFIFNGSDQTSTLASLNLQQNFTLAGWYNPSVLNGFAIFGQGILAANQGLHIWYTSNTLIRFGMFGNDTDFTVSTPINNWYYIVCTYNNSSPFTKQLYINGSVQTGVTQQAQSAYTGTGTFRLGATYSSAGNYGSGSFAYMAMYNRILSATEILQNYNALKGRFGL
jgi:hypothetical protein